MVCEIAVRRRSDRVNILMVGGKIRGLEVYLYIALRLIHLRDDELVWSAVPDMLSLGRVELLWLARWMRLGKVLSECWHYNVHCVMKFKISPYHNLET